QGFVIGQAGPTTADTFSSTIAFEPSRSLQLSAGTTYSKFSSSSATTISGSATTGTTSTTTQGVTAGASYRVSRWLTARTSYSFYHQEQKPGGTIPHNVVLIGLDFSYPVRVDRLTIGCGASALCGFSYESSCTVRIFLVYRLR